jgi:hypothetical protein
MRSGRPQRSINCTGPADRIASLGLLQVGNQNYLPYDLAAAWVLEGSCDLITDLGNVLYEPLAKTEVLRGATILENGYGCGGGLDRGSGSRAKC